MLLRSLSTPILSSWFEPDIISPDPIIIIKKTKSFSLNPTNDPLIMNKKIPALNPSSRRRRHSSTVERTSMDAVVLEGERESGLQTVVVGGGGGGGGGGRICGGGRGGGDGSGDGFEGTDEYYRKMIESDPNNGLLLGNYAKFLKEFRGDLTKAEEYCGRAILVNPNDGNALSMYGDLIWQTERDASRAESYFEQAVETDPDDSYVLASYARFLWDADDEEENDNAEAEYKSRINLVRGASHQSPLTTAS